MMFAIESAQPSSRHIALPSAHPPAARALQAALASSGLAVGQLIRASRLSPRQCEALEVTDGLSYLRGVRGGYEAGGTVRPLSFPNADFKRGWSHGTEAQRLLRTTDSQWGPSVWGRMRMITG